MTGFALRSPVAVLAAGAVLAVAGLGGGLPDQGRLRHPRAGAADLPAVRDLVALQEATGVYGDVDVVVEPPTSRSRP